METNIANHPELIHLGVLDIILKSGTIATNMGILNINVLSS